MLSIIKSNSKVDFNRLSPDEFQNAKVIFCREAQLESYPEEHNQLKSIKLIPQNSPFLPFKPFMHESLINRLSIKQQPFTYTGVDYFGPIYVKFSRKTRSNQAIAKSHGVIFTCLTVQAVHIELASCLTTEVFLLTLRCFIARRRKPKEILIDNR